MIQLLKKKYDGESIVDVERDVLECFDARFNKLVDEIPADEHGIQKGTFTVTVQWENTDADDV